MSDSARILQKVAIPILLIMGAILRLVQLTELEFDIDEACSYLYVTSPLGIMKSLEQDANAPLYFYLLKGWIHLFSGTDFAVRGFSVLMGVLLIGALPLVMRAYGVASGARTWAVALAAFSPLHIFHSQNARGYALVQLVLLLLLWAYANAERRRDWVGWIGLGLVQIAALATHNMFLPVVAALWIGSAFLGFSRGDYRKWAMVQGSVGLLYFPWLVKTMAVSSTPGLEWIKPVWDSTPPMLAIPRSLELFGIGGRFPAYFRDLSMTPSDPIRFLSIGFFTIVGGGLIGFRKSVEAEHVRAGTLKLMLTCLLFPLVFQFGYSIFRMPIYVVGRYDSIVLPVYFILMGIGIHAIQQRVGGIHAHAAKIIPWGIFPVLVFFSLYPRYRPLPDLPLEMINRTRARGEMIEQQSKPDELIVCLALTGSLVTHELAQRGVKRELINFPQSTSEHIGWFSPRMAFADWNVVRKEVNEIVEMAGPRYRGVWVVVDAQSRSILSGGSPEESDYTRSASLLLGGLQRSAKKVTLHENLDMVHFEMGE